MVYRLEPFWVTSPILFPFSSLNSKLGVLRSIVAILLCESPLERRTLELLHPLLEIYKDSGIYDLPRLHNLSYT